MVKFLLPLGVIQRLFHNLKINLIIKRLGVLKILLFSNNKSFSCNGLFFIFSKNDELLFCDKSFILFNY
jgi:hypothetical protein